MNKTVKASETQGLNDMPWGYRTHAAEIGARMGWFFVAYLRSIYERFDGDMVLPLVLGEIAHHNICDYFSNCSPVPGRVDKEKSVLAVPSDKMHPCNAFSLSEATGIPRETIRRKIAELERRGWVRKHEKGGYVIVPNLVAEFSGNFNADLLRRLLLLTDDLRSLVNKPDAKTQNGQPGNG